MNKSLQEKSNCVQGHAEECGSSSTRSSPRESGEINGNLPLPELAYQTSYIQKRYGSSKRRKKLLKRFKKQMGFETITASSFALDALSKYAGIDVPDFVIREIEGIVLLLTNLSQQQTVLGVTSAILLHARAYAKKSLLGQIKEYIEEVMSPYEKQAGGVPDWLSCLRNVKQNWQLCKNNKGFQQISKLLGVLVVLGLCKASDLEFSIGNFKIFTPNMFERHMSALDLTDALFETVLFFTEGMYLCFVTGSLRPLLINDHSALEMDEEYARITAWWDLVRVGNLKKFSGISEQEFERRMNDLSTNLKNLSSSLKGLDKKLVMDKFQKILIMQNDFITMKIASGVRRAPFVVELFGESSQGKTTLGDQLLDALLTSANLPTDKRFRAAHNPSDKFMSNWTSDKLVLIFDDVANDKSSFVERPPTRAIIDVCNNQMFYANKAELNEKGKCFVEPELCLITTNKKDLDAGLYSNCPYSIQRRATSVTVTVRPEFQKIVEGVNCGVDSTKVRKHYTIDGVYTPPMFDDIWLVTIEQAVKPSELHIVATYEAVSWNGMVLKDVSMSTAIQYFIDEFEQHRDNQDAILAGMRARSSQMERCSEDCNHLKGNCPIHNVLSSEEEQCLELDENLPRHFYECSNPACHRAHESQLAVQLCCDKCVEKQFGFETVKSLRRLICNCRAKFSPGWGSLQAKVDQTAAELLYSTGSRLIEQWQWIKCVPTPCLNTNFILWKKLSDWYGADVSPDDVLRWYYKDVIVEEYTQRLWSLWFLYFLTLPLLFCGPCGIICCLVGFLLAVHSQKNLLERIEKSLFERLREDNAAVSPIVKRYRDNCAKWICGAFIGVACAYGLAVAYRDWKKTQKQGSLEPKTQEEIDERDAEVNVWTGVQARDLPISKDSKCVNVDSLQSQIAKGLVYGTIHLEGQDDARMNCFFVDSNVILMPYHYLTDFGPNLRCTMRKANPEKCGGKFAADISMTAAIHIPDSDLCIAYCATGGSFPSMLKHFPLSLVPQVPVRLQWRKKTGDMLHMRGVSEPMMCNNGDRDFLGAKTHLTQPTFGGLCGGVYVSETVGSVILGLHVGGHDGENIGSFSSVTQQHLKSAITQLRKVEGVITSGSAGNFEKQVLGATIMTDQPLHPKSPLNYMPENSQVEYYGSCIGKAITKSDVKVTPISELVMDVCGAPNVYCAPKMNPDWFAWQTCLSNLAVPAVPYPHDLLSLAIRDYKSELLPIFESDLWKSARPLTDHENLNGIPGRKFMDAIKLNTAIGYPLVGVKRKFVTELPPTEEKPNNREFDPIIMSEIERCESCYRRGERAYPIAKACKKDEILTKEKCRIFYGNAIALTYLIRKYYLPILRVLQMNPLLSECAVGINSHGPEWEEFHQHATKHGMDRLFGGDYGKYDQKLPSQLIFAALRIMIDFARICDYSQEDLDVMEAMTGDIVFAIIAFNGDLIGLTEGTHISGNSLTVVINGICGSLNLRCFYYTMHPCEHFESRRKFRDYVAAMTYGDDNIGSVSAEEEGFTIAGISKFLEGYGQVYTMPDKESDLLDFLPSEEFEFLKRDSVYHPQLGVHVGALLEKSIFKSLHCFMRPKGCQMTESEACAQNIDGALREWFNHGEEIYEKRRQEMVRVAECANITHLCTGLHTPYSDRVSEWKDRYGKQYKKFAYSTSELC